MQYTLGFVKFNNNNLLIHNNVGRFENKFNGIGGHLLDNEKPIDGLIREIKEKSGLNVIEEIIKPEGTLKFQTDHSPHDTVYIYSVILNDQSQEIVASEKGEILCFSDADVCNPENRDRFAPAVAYMFYNCFKDEVWSYKILYESKNNSMSIVEIMKDEKCK